MQAPVVPSRNPQTYCRLCLSQVNILTVLDASDADISPHKELLQKLFHYAKISLSLKEDYPSAICGICREQLNDFHEFRRIVVRNHNAVKNFRRTHGDEIPLEEEEYYMDVVDDEPEPPVEAARQDSGGSILVLQPGEEIIKEVDVYHLDGELRTVVVKQEDNAIIEGIQVVGDNRKVMMKKPMQSPPMKSLPHILNKQASPGLTTPPQRMTVQQKVTTPPEKRVKMLANETVFSLYRCSQCSAVFRNSENLALHEKNDHPRVVHLQKNPSRPAAKPPQSRPVKPQQNTHQQLQQQKITILYKCPQCSSSFIEEANYRQHAATCKAAVLAKLDLSQITIKRTGGGGGGASLPQRIAAAAVKKEPEPNGFKCSECPLTYKTKFSVQKHLLTVHKIGNNEKVYYCALCKLNYSCNEDLQLHNRAIHPFHCTRCNGDYRQCMHNQVEDNKAKAI